MVSPPKYTSQSMLCMNHMEAKAKIYILVIYLKTGIFSFSIETEKKRKVPRVRFNSCPGRLRLASLHGAAIG